MINHARCRSPIVLVNYVCTMSMTNTEVIVKSTGALQSPLHCANQVELTLKLDLAIFSRYKFAGLTVKWFYKWVIHLLNSLSI